MTQGSRVAATLGFEPESRWDSRMARVGVKEMRGVDIPITAFNPRTPGFLHPLLITPDPGMRLGNSG